MDHINSTEIIIRPKVNWGDSAVQYSVHKVTDRYNTDISATASILYSLYCARATGHIPAFMVTIYKAVQEISESQQI